MAEVEMNMVSERSPAAENITNNRNGEHQPEPQRFGRGPYSRAVDEEQRTKLLAELNKEKDTLKPELQPHLYKLIQKEINRVATSPEAEYCQELDLYHDLPITLNVKCFPPTKQFPKSNYPGRVIGPKGTYLKALMKETNTRMIVLGKGVMKDKAKEEELRKGSDPRYFHLNEEMHVSITATANSFDAYRAMAYAIGCLKRQLLCDHREVSNLPWIMRAAERQANQGGQTDPPPGISGSVLPSPHPHGGPMPPPDAGYGLGSPPPPKRRPIAPGFSPQDSRYFETREPYPREDRPPTSLPPARDYYDEYARPPALEYPRLPAQQLPPPADKFSRDALYTRPTYEYEASPPTAPTGYYDRNPWGEGGGRMRAPAPAASPRFDPYRKF